MEISQKKDYILLIKKSSRKKLFVINEIKLFLLHGKFNFLSFHIEPLIIILCYELEWDGDPKKINLFLSAKEVKNLNTILSNILNEG